MGVEKLKESLPEIWLPGITRHFVPDFPRVAPERGRLYDAARTCKSMLQRIMMVEDSEGEALLVKQRLRDAGFSEPLYHMSDSVEALNYLQGKGQYADRRRYPIPEILLLDLSMPNVDGFQLLRWIRSQPHLSPMVVVVLTAELDPRRISLAYQLGANSYLAKDGSMEEYENFVQFFRSYAAIANATPLMVEDELPTISLPQVSKPAAGSENGPSKFGML